MMAEGAGDFIARVARIYERGIICPAELWFQIEQRLTPGSVKEALDRLPADARNILRRAYVDRPISLDGEATASEVRREMIAWCHERSG
jgi:hypothetical protein